MLTHKRKISVIVPVFNEQDNIPVIYQLVSDILLMISDKYIHEIIFVNDGSTDASWHVITTIAQTDPSVKALQFTRNFGHQAALTAGYQIAQGDAVISMDADLQDTPALLLELIKAWEQGAQIVYARRTNRNDGILKKITATLFYKLLHHVSDVSMPRNVGDFRLLDKKVVLLLRQFPERSRYLRGLVAWTGFTHAFVDFNRQNRIAGHTGYTWKKMFKLAFDGLTGFSLFPLRIALFSGLMIIMCSQILFMTMIMRCAFYDACYSFSSWLLVGVSFFLGVQSLCIWLLGEYVGRIYEQQKERPMFIVSERINCEEAVENAPQYNAMENKQENEKTY